MYFGDHDSVRHDSSQIELESLKESNEIFIHPWYNDDETEHDVAIIKLPEALDIGSRDSTTAHKIDYACLPTRDQVIRPGTKCWIAGWGQRSEENEDLPQDIREAEVSMFSDLQCGSKLGFGFRSQKDTLVCAGDEKDKGEVDICYGDSGGPLMCAVDGQPVVVGVTSWVLNACATPGEPGAFAEVSASQHLSWIQSMLEH